MCIFFSFITNGNGKAIYANYNERKRNYNKSKIFNDNMDSHTYLAYTHFGKLDLPNYQNNYPDDFCNKYEYKYDMIDNTFKFVVDQINTKDDSKQVEKWLKDFIKTKEFSQICEISYKSNDKGLILYPVRTEKMCILACKKDFYKLSACFKQNKKIIDAAFSSFKEVACVKEKIKREYLCDSFFERVHESMLEYTVNLFLKQLMR